MRNTVGDAAPAELQQAFLRQGAGMVEYFEKNTAVRLVARSYSPDYYPDREGAALGGRSLDPAMFDGRELGAKFKELRNPLPEFMVLGGMMITMTDAKHLLAVTRSFGSWREGTKLVLRYFSDRLRGYHRGTRVVLGNALAARLFKSVLDRASVLARHAAAEVARRRWHRGRRGAAARGQDDERAGAARRRRGDGRLSLEREPARRAIPPAHRAVVHVAPGQSRRRHLAGPRRRRRDGPGPHQPGLLGAGVDPGAGRRHGGSLSPPGVGPRQAGADGGQRRRPPLRQRIHLVPRVRARHVPLPRERAPPCPPTWCATTTSWRSGAWAWRCRVGGRATIC